jgi:hypothetical protein
VADHPAPSRRDYRPRSRGGQARVQAMMTMRKIDIATIGRRERARPTHCAPAVRPFGASAIGRALRGGCRSRRCEGFALLHNVHADELGR